jgi:hypothetical protein
MENKSMEYKRSYGKRPLWQWIIIYIVIGGILYTGVYYLVLRRGSVYGSNQPSYSQMAPNSTSQQQQTPPMGY